MPEKNPQADKKLDDRVRDDFERANPADLTTRAYEAGDGDTFRKMREIDDEVERRKAQQAAQDEATRRQRQQDRVRTLQTERQTPAPAPHPSWENDPHRADPDQVQRDATAQIKREDKGRIADIETSRTPQKEAAVSAAEQAAAQPSQDQRPDPLRTAMHEVYQASHDLEAQRGREHSQNYNARVEAVRQTGHADPKKVVSEARWDQRKADIANAHGNIDAAFNLHHPDYRNDQALTQLNGEMHDNLTKSHIDRSEQAKSFMNERQARIDAARAGGDAKPEITVARQQREARDDIIQAGHGRIDTSFERASREKTQDHSQDQALSQTHQNSMATKTTDIRDMDISQLRGLVGDLERHGGTLSVSDGVATHSYETPSQEAGNHDLGHDFDAAAHDFGFDAGSGGGDGSGGQG